MDQHRFDDLSRTFANTAGRRDVLKIIGGLAATLFGAKAATPVTAEGGGNSDCAHFCNETFPPGSERGKCKSDAAHGTGLCFMCGPAASGNHGPVCGVQTTPVCCSPGQTCCGNVTCATLQTDVNNCGACGNVCPAPANATAVCTGGACGFTCNAGFVACGGQCVSNTCPPGQSFNPTTCRCEQSQTCPPGRFICGTSRNQRNQCVCRTSTEGTTFCGEPGIYSCSRGCNSSSECPSGFVCLAAFPIQPGFPGACVAKCGEDSARACA